MVASLSSNLQIKYSIQIGTFSKTPVKTVVMMDVDGNILSSSLQIRYSIYRNIPKTHYIRTRII
jgi:hypothetical protein